MEWKEIKNSGYFASKDGQIKNKKGKILKGSNRGNGYLSVHINLGDGCKHYSIHRLILETFSPIAEPDLFHVDHIDKNKQNNKLENLRWVSANENNKLKNDPQYNLSEKDIYFLLNQVIEKIGKDETIQLLEQTLAAG